MADAVSFGAHCGISGCTAKHEPTLFGAEGDCTISPAKTTSERVDKLRKERADMSLKRKEVYVHDDDWPELLKLAKRLERRRAKLLASGAG